ncbi:MAG: hypothetical protein AB7G23_00325 [Vicinamibacterales bacterium]
MAIRTSSAREVERLIADLHEADPSARETAVARLRIIGPRAIARLSALLDGTSAPAVRADALRVLEGQADPRARTLALTALASVDATVLLAAIAVLRGWLPDDADARVRDALTGLALDPARPGDAREAARHAVGGGGLDAAGSTSASDDNGAPLRGAVAEPVAPAAFTDPREARHWVDAHADAPLSTLHGLVEHARLQEQSARPDTRQEWLAARGAAHEALARRGSRVALYDLRESFHGAAVALPFGFLHAMAALGDAACLDALARAWEAAAGDPWWQQHLAETARAVAEREGLDERHTAVKRLRDRWPAFPLSTTSRTRRARSPGRRT